jgi:hypothetical protein
LKLPAFTIREKLFIECGLILLEVVEMAKLVVEIPEVKLDEKTMSELREDIKSVVRLRLAREKLLKRLDKMLEDSTLTDEDCLILGEEAKEGVAEEWKRRGWL